ncbi:MAG: hypothetical protein J6T94_06935 [Bacteroidaceae bacterium]|nr:hypothetical protein [Bacteroidaceae bacterium]
MKKGKIFFEKEKIFLDKEKNRQVKELEVAGRQPRAEERSRQFFLPYLWG